jgi:hypothetical protein
MAQPRRMAVRKWCGRKAAFEGLDDMRLGDLTRSRAAVLRSSDSRDGAARRRRLLLVVAMLAVVSLTAGVCTNTSAGAGSSGPRATDASAASVIAAAQLLSLHVAGPNRRPRSS